MAAVTVIGNLLTLIAFWREPKLREKPSDMLICALAGVDFVTGLVVMPLMSPLYITPGDWPLGEAGCRVLISLSNIVLNSNLVLLIFISLDRYLLVSREYPQYVKIQSEHRIYACILLSFCLAALAVGAEQGPWEYAKTVNAVAAGIDYDKFCLSPPRRITRFSIGFFVVSYLLPVVIVGILSVAFLYLLRKRMKKNLTQVRPSDTASSSQAHSDNHATNTTTTTTTRGDETSALEVATISAVKTSAPTTEGQHQQAENSTRNRYIKPAITLIALVTAMGICMLPYCLYVVVVNWFCPQCANVEVLYAVLLLQYCNSCLDPILYAATQSKIRKFYRARFNALLR